LCGGLPLAILAVAAQLALRPSLTLPALVNRMMTARRRHGTMAAMAAATPDEETSIVAALDTSLDELPPDTAAACRWIAVGIPGPTFTAEAAADVVRTTPEDAEATLAALARASLVEEVGPERYRLHDVVRDQVRDRALREMSEDDRAAAIGRGVAYYLTAAAAAERCAAPARRRLSPIFREASYLADTDLPAFGSPASALEWLDTEVDNILAAQAAAAEAGLLAPAWWFVEVVWEWMLHRRDYARWAAVTELAVRCAADCHDQRAHAWVMIFQSARCRSQGDIAAALAHVTTALDIAYRAGDALGEASAREHLGVTHRVDGRATAAIGELTEAIWINQLVGGTDRALALCRHQLGLAYLGIGDHPKAHAALSDAEHGFAALGDAYNSAQVKASMAEWLTATGKPADAIPLLEQALTALQDLDPHYHSARIQIGLGEAHEQLGHLDAARTHARLAAALYAQLGTRQGHPEYRRVRDLLDRHGATDTDTGAVIGESRPGTD
jgi:tetratricopeptide (TPR) repeat protein